MRVVCNFAADRAAREAVETAQLEGHRTAREELCLIVNSCVRVLSSVQELCREQRHLRAEVAEQTQRLTSVERRAKALGQLCSWHRLARVPRCLQDVARGEEASAQRVAALSEQATMTENVLVAAMHTSVEPRNQVERLARAAQSAGDAGNRELFAELKTAVSRVEELQNQAVSISSCLKRKMSA